MITLGNINSLSERIQKIATLVHGSIQIDDQGIDIECGVKNHNAPSRMSFNYQELIHGDGTNEVSIRSSCSAPGDQGDSWLLELEVGEQLDAVTEPEITIKKSEYHGFPVTPEDALSSINELVSEALAQFIGAQVS